MRDVKLDGGPCDGRTVSLPDDHLYGRPFQVPDPEDADLFHTYRDGPPRSGTAVFRKSVRRDRLSAAAPVHAPAATDPETVQ
jgi:hypothetical protein